MARSIDVRMRDPATHKEEMGITENTTSTPSEGAVLSGRPVEGRLSLMCATSCHSHLL